MRRVLIHALVIIFILLIGALPMISVLVAGTNADRNNCELHEGFVNPCIIDGEDWGETLYAMGMMGWFGLVTIPGALLIAAAYLLIVISVAIIRYVRRRNMAPQAQT